jgi:mannose/cellobiose epimerase-like protein (N-acyl-D-glucosamine 2-epimerase family)
MTDLHWNGRWLAEQAIDLEDCARRSALPDGFGWLNATGAIDDSQPIHTWITCRMTYVFALAHLRGVPDVAPFVDHGLAALRGLLRDTTNDGWYASVAPDGTPYDARKAAYPHTFVVLAAAAATLAGRPTGPDLLAEALGVVRAYFWDDAAGRTIESYAPDWSDSEPYRGANSSMHMVEAFLAAGDATGDGAWHTRAFRIAAHLIHDVAAGHGWRLPEHFTEHWSPRPDYNVDRPADQFRPYGVTIGHLLEWSRLLLHVEAALPDPPSWLLSDAVALFGAATSRGWAVDGANGFVYTLDWHDRPVVRHRMHWVVAEAIGAASVLGRRTGHDDYHRWYDRFWSYTQAYVLDPGAGGWRHELDEHNQPSAAVWSGKPDVYHAYQAVLLPHMTTAPSLAGALARSGESVT